MPADATVRPAKPADLPFIAAIHNHAIAETAASWLWEPIPMPQREAWFAAQAEAERPVLVAEMDGAIAGWASYGPFRAYHGYRDTMEHSVYLDPTFHRRGVGRALMAQLLDAAKIRGVHVMVAAIALPNDPSVGLHEALGFTCIGVMPEVGLKFGTYRDLCLMQRIL